MRGLILILIGSFSTLIAGEPVKEKRSLDPWDSFSGVSVSSGIGGGFAHSGIIPVPVPYPVYRPFPDTFPGSFYNPFDYPFRISFPVPWYKGENVCVETRTAEEPEEFKKILGDVDFDSDGSFQFGHESEHCRGTNTLYVCRGRKSSAEGGKMYVTKYQCCHGFVRAHHGPGCIENSDKPEKTATPDPSSVEVEKMSDSTMYSFVSKVDLKNLAPSLRELRASQFVDLASSIGMNERLHDENFTIFCPRDEVWESFFKNSRVQEKKTLLPGRRKSQLLEENRELKKIVKSHMTKGFLRSDDIEDEIILRTEDPHTKIRLNVYYIPYKMVTANCVSIAQLDNFARNGVIHIVEKVLPIPTKTVADIITSDLQFSILKGLLSRAGFVHRLRDPNNNFTIFAPTDSAFKSKPYLHERIKSGNICASSLVENHILAHVVCASALPSYAQSLNMLGELVTLSRELDNKIYVDDIQVVVKDIMGTNGVVHIIDGLLMPRQAASVIQVLQETGMTEFLDLLELADLKSVFDRMQNVTFFVPSNEAIRKLRAQRNRWSSRNSLQKTLLYHVAKTEFSMNNTKDNQMIETQLDTKNIRIKQYSLYPYINKQMTVQCARILSPDNKLCRSMLHVVDRLLVPSKNSVMDVLESQDMFSGFVRLLRVSGLDQRLRSREESFTILAPVNDVFFKNPNSILEKLMRERVKAVEFVKMHILSEPLCCEQLQHSFYSGRQQTRSVDGSLLRIMSAPNGSIRIGEAKVLECDSTADNGVVHGIDNSVFPDRSGMNGGFQFHNYL